MDFKNWGPLTSPSPLQHKMSDVPPSPGVISQSSLSRSQILPKCKFLFNLRLKLSYQPFLQSDVGKDM